MTELRSTLAGRVTLAVLSALILLFLVLPIVVIVVTSFGKDAFGSFPPSSWTLDWYEVLFADGSKWPAALSLSVLVASLTTVFSLILGMTAATALVRSDLPLRTAVYGLVLAPLVIPQVVIALGHTVLASPIAVMILMATLKGIDERLEDAAASMGASRLTVARRITFPLAMPGLVAAAIFSFITSFDEFFISQFLSSVDTVTLPVQVFNVLQYDVDPSVTAVSAILIAIAVVALALVAVVRRLSGSGKQDGLLPTDPGVGLAAGSETTS